MTRRSRSTWPGVAAALLLSAAPAHAAGGAAGPGVRPGPSSSSRTAATLVMHGVQLYKEHDYAAARDAFTQAYVLDPQPGTLLNLALSELKADDPISAAAHFREYLKASTEPAEKRESVQSVYLPLAEAQTARIDVYAPASLEIRIDGKPLEPNRVIADATPVPGRVASIVVHVGEHTVSAGEGAAQRTERIAPKGGELVDVHLEPAEPAAAPAIASPVAVDAPPPRDERATRAKWITVIALGSGAVLAVGLGAGWTLAAQHQASDVDAIRSRIDPGRTGTACFGTAAGSPPCMTLNDESQAARRNWTLSLASYVSAGVLATASLAAWGLWHPSSRAQAGMRLTPTVANRTAGLALDGAF